VLRQEQGELAVSHGNPVDLERLERDGVGRLLVGRPVVTAQGEGPGRNAHHLLGGGGRRQQQQHAKDNACLRDCGLCNHQARYRQRRHSGIFIDWVVRPKADFTNAAKDLRIGAHGDLFALTLDKSAGSFSPNTRYRDYAIGPSTLHWESQSRTRAESPTGQRYQHHAALGSAVMLFGRPNTSERAFHFLGPGTYIEHRSEMPMAIRWRLAHALPGDLFVQYATAAA
jgi:hypothetical protein